MTRIRLLFAVFNLLGLSAVINFLLLTPTIYFLQVFDRVLTMQNPDTLIAISLIALYLWGLLTIGDKARAAYAQKLAAQLERQVLMRQEATNTFDTATVVPSPLDHYRRCQHWSRLLSSNTFLALLDVPFACVFLAALYLLHPTLAELGLAMYAVQILVALAQHLFISRLSAKHAEGKQQQVRYIDQLALIAPSAHTQGFWHLLAEKHSKTGSHIGELAFSLQTRASAAQHLSKWTKQVQQACVLAVAGVLAMDGEISAAAVIAANAFMSRALGPVDTAIQGWRSVLMAWRSRAILVNPRAGNTDATESLQQASVLVQTKDLSAITTGKATTILNNISADFPAGSTTIVIGPSGSGKSVFGRALLGIERSLSLSGERLINGKRVSFFAPLVDWCDTGYVPQEPQLFDGTIAENIARMGALDHQAVIAAAQLVGAHQDILALAKGYDTPLQLPTTAVASGLLQRISLARACYKNPRWVLLDEPDAYLDVKARQALAAMIKSLQASGTTIVMITHDKSWLALCDRVILLVNGIVEASGPREGVLQALNAKYATQQTLPKSKRPEL